MMSRHLKLLLCFLATPPLAQETSSRNAETFEIGGNRAAHSNSLSAILFSAGSTGLDYGKAVTVDDARNVRLASYFQNTADFAPRVGRVEPRREEFRGYRHHRAWRRRDAAVGEV